MPFTITLLYGIMVAQCTDCEDSIMMSPTELAIERINLRMELLFDLHAVGMIDRTILTERIDTLMRYQQHSLLEQLAEENDDEH